MLKREAIGIRDPFILVHENYYYLYGTRNTTVWGRADGFDAYKSKDLEFWEGPFEVFHNNGDFWATENYWAPECIYRNGAFYLISTFGNPSRTKGIQILKSESPLGPFEPITIGPITPNNWNCIDGTIYNDSNNKNWLIFSHGLKEEIRGAICAAELSDDLTSLETEPITLFYADEAPWAKPIPFAKSEFDMDGNVFLSDGPYVIKEEDGSLSMIWSSWNEGGYSIGISNSKNGKLEGPWHHQEKLLSQDGGHGMVFTSFEGKKILTYHAPNNTPDERPVFLEI